MEKQEMMKEVDRLIDALDEESIQQALSYVLDMIFIIQSRWTKFREMLFRQWSLEIVTIQLSFLLRTKHQAYFLYTARNKLLKKDEDDRTHHAIRTGYGEEVFLHASCGRIESCAITSHWDNGFPYGMYRTHGEFICLHATGVKIVD